MNTEKKFLAIILLLYVLITLGYSMGPIFEGPDEHRHYSYIFDIIDQKNLPDPLTEDYAQHHQAPLYYLLLTPLALPLHDDQLAAYKTEVWRNPFVTDHPEISGGQNRNQFLHTRTEAFPYDKNETALAAHLLRLPSILMGLGTLWLCYKIFGLLWEDQPYRRLLALALIAFCPLFQRMSGVISNDNLSYLLATACLYLILLGQRTAPTWRMSILLGVLLGLNLSTKTSTVVMALPVGMAVLLDRRWWRFAPTILGLTLLFGGWWYVRNWLNYDDPFLTRAFGETWHLSSHDLAFNWDRAQQNTRTIPQSFWGQFELLIFPPVFQRLFELLILTSAFGWMLYGMRGRLNRLAFQQAAMLAALILGGLAWVIYISGSTYNAFYARLWLISSAGLAAIVAFGLDQLFPSRFKKALTLSLAGGLAATAAIILAGIYLPAYCPLPLAEDIARPLQNQHGDLAELIGMSPALPQGQAGDLIEIQLHWRALKPSTSRDLIVYLNSGADEIIRAHSYPGGGNLLASDWKAGETWTERYFVRLPDDAGAQTSFPLFAGLYDTQTGQNLPADQAQIGQVAINGSPREDRSADYRFGEIIGLKQPSMESTQDGLNICLEWISLGVTTESYQVFVQLFDGVNSSPLAQADHAPKAGAYPTNAWLAGEHIAYCISLPQATGGNGQVKIGLYSLADGVRLPAYDEKGARLPDDAVSLPLER